MPPPASPAALCAASSAGQTDRQEEPMDINSRAFAQFVALLVERMRKADREAG